MTLNIQELKQIRNSLGWTLCDLSEKAGISVASICRIEKLKGGIRLDTLETLLNTMGYHLEIVKDEPKTDCPWM